MSDRQEPLPEWLAEIEARLRDGCATFGAKTVLELVAVCKAQRKALTRAVAFVPPYRLNELNEKSLVLHDRARRLWEGK